MNRAGHLVVVPGPVDAHLRAMLLDEYEREMRSHYEEIGYIVIRGLLDANLIDALLDRCANAVDPSIRAFARRGSGVATSPSNLDQSRAPVELSAALLRISFDRKLLSALASLDGNARHDLTCTTLSDLNAEAAPRQDWWHFNRRNGGRLIAASIALEDVQDDAGGLFLLPGSHAALPDADRRMSGADRVARVRAYMVKNAPRLCAPTLKKGDVLFWNARTIHGAMPVMDRRHTRRSLTVHYLPREVGLRSLFAIGNRIASRSRRLTVAADQPAETRPQAMADWIRNSALIARLARLVQRMVPSKGRQA